MRISDWSSDVCSSDLLGERAAPRVALLVEIFVAVDAERLVPPRPIGADGAELAVVGGHRHRLPCRNARIVIAKAEAVVEQAKGHADRLAERGIARQREIGRASCRVRGCQYV